LINSKTILYMFCSLRGDYRIFGYFFAVASNLFLEKKGLQASTKKMADRYLETGEKN
jgi:hypothetical protein